MATQTIRIKTTTIKKRDKKKNSSSTSRRGKNKRCPTCGKFMP